jgi:NitT/TauT family transport system ATP-binding protein
LRAEFGRLVRKNGKTAVFVTHSINEALYVGDRVLVFHRPAQIAFEAEVTRDATDAEQEGLRQQILQVLTASTGSDETTEAESLT